MQKTENILQQAIQLHMAGKLNEAEAIYNEVLELEPNHDLALHYLGALTQQTGRPQAAIVYYRRAIEANPTNPDYMINAGTVLRQLGRFDEARAKYEAALKIKPDYAEALCNLGNIHIIQGQPDEAIDALKRAISIKPEFVVAWSNLGNAYQMAGRLSKAELCLAEAVSLQADFPEGYNNLGYVLQLQGRIDPAIRLYREAIKLRPDFREAYSNLIFGLQYSPNADQKARLAQRVEWAKRFAHSTSEAKRNWANSKVKGRKLRVGYVSPNFRTHSDAYFLEPLLSNHDSSGFEVFCYAEVARPDETTKRLRSLADHWHNSTGTSDHALALQIQQDAVDILVDLAGHMNGNRLRLFSLNPAPIQVSFQGMGPTGLEQIPFRISDRYQEENFSSDPIREKVLQLDHSSLVYSPPAFDLECAPLPAHSKGYVTFGSFNNRSKLNEQVIESWAAILKAVEDSRLILKAGAFQDADAREAMMKSFESQGVPKDRIELRPSTLSREQHLATYNEIDIGLDPFPYSGGTTTWEALWMGVPVVTLAGQGPIERMSGSLLNELELHPLIAGTKEDYVKVATALSKDMEQLSELRSSLRQRILGSPLRDEAGLVANLERIYRRLWEDWCDE